MKKTYLFFILPALLTLLCFSLVSIYFIYSNQQVLISSDNLHFFIFLFLMVGVLSVQLSYFTWKYMWRTESELMQIIKIAQSLDESSFAQRFSYKLSSADKVSQLRSVLNNLVGKIEKRIVSLRLQVNEKMAVLSSMREAVIAVNLNERVYIYNKAAQNLFSTNSSSEPRQSLASLVRIPEIYNYLSHCIENQLDTSENLFFKEVYIGQKLRDLNLHIKSAVVRGKKDRVTGLVFVINDVTEIKKLEKHRTDFVGNVSHELKTPLTLIQGFSETLLNNKQLSSEESLKYIGIIHKHSSRLGTLINDLLAISKLENAGSVDLEMEPQKISLLVKNALSLCSESARENNIELIFTDESHGCEVLMNFSLLEQSLVNLIENAIKYSPKHKSVEVKLTLTQQNVSIHVTDQGCGMDSRHLQRIFERFYRVDKGRSRDVGGTGLGLSIVKHVTQLHKGSVSVDSQVGQGSTFTVLLPLNDSVTV